MKKEKLTANVNLDLSVLNFDYLNKLPIININGEDIVDFSEPVFTQGLTVNYQQSPVIVTEEFAGRPHLLSKAVYGVEDHADMLLYFNGISNPFSLAAGMVIKIPTTDSMNAAFSINKANKVNKAKVEFNKKLSQKDKDILKNTIENSEIRPSNIVADGTTPFVNNGDGTLTLGTNVVTKKCKTDLSKTQLISEKIRAAVIEKTKAQSKVKLSAIRANIATAQSASGNILKR